MKFYKLMMMAALVITQALFVVSCGSSGGGSDDDDSDDESQISGTAAVGAAIDGFVFAKDADGVEINVATGVDGSFTLNADGLVATIMLKVVPNDGSDTQYSFAAENAQTVNLTPMTNLALFLAADSESLDDIYNNWDGTAITQAEVIEAQETLNANFFDLITAAGLDPTTYDFLQAEFDADGTGIDGVLDSITIVVDNDAGTFTASDDTDVTFVFDEEIDTSDIDIGDTVSEETDATVPVSIADDQIIIQFSLASAGSVYGDEEQVSIFYPDNTSLSVTNGDVVETILTGAINYQGDTDRIIWFDDANSLAYTLVLESGNFSALEVSSNNHVDEDDYILYGQFEMLSF